MVVCAPARRAHSPPGAGHRGNRVVFLFICRKVFLQGAWRHSPAYLCTRPLAGRAGTPKGQRIFRQNRRLRRRERTLRALRAHADTPDTRIRTTRRHAQRAPPHTHTRGIQRPAASAGCRAGFRAISGLTEGVVRSTFLARSPVGERGFLRRKKPIFRDVAILLFHYTLFF